MNQAVSGKWVAVGQVVSSHGLTGTVKVKPLTGSMSRLQELQKVLVKTPSLKHPRVFAIEQVVFVGRMWLVKLAGLDTREEAAALTGGLLLVPQQERAVLPGGTYYVDQIIGLVVRDEAGVALGRVERVLSAKGHDLYVIRPEADKMAPEGEEPGCSRKTREREWFLPAVKEFVLQIDVAGGFMTVRLPEGLIGL